MSSSAAAAAAASSSSSSEPPTPAEASASASKEEEEEIPPPPPIAANLDAVQSRITSAVSACNRPANSVRLVAVSKTKPLALLRTAYDAGQRRFGENYAQELIQKAGDMPSDVRWHFIGPLQSNKAAKLVKGVGLEKLVCIETVSTLKLANKLNKAVEDLLLLAEGGDGQDDDEEEEEGTKKKKKKKARLGIYLQVNTSGEQSKSGVVPGSALTALATDIATNCPHLSIDGLMTIGAPGDLTCFDALVACREEVAAELGRRNAVETLDLSMGMSGDFEEAIKRGATSVRVGSTLFGARDYSNLSKK